MWELWPWELGVPCPIPAGGDGQQGSGSCGAWIQAVCETQDTPGHPPTSALLLRPRCCGRPWGRRDEFLWDESLWDDSFLVMLLAVSISWC